MSINQTYKNFIIYDSLTGEILFNGSCPSYDYEIQKQNGKNIIEGMLDVFSGYVLNDILYEYTLEQKTTKLNKPNYSCKWSNQTFQWIDLRTDQEKVLEAQSTIKLKRNQLLMESDWTQLPDVPLTNKDQWATYRQQLRDITEQSGYPFNVIWPDLP